MLGDTLVLFVDTVESGEREESFAFLVLVKYVGEEVLFVTGNKLVELGW